MQKNLTIVSYLMVASCTVGPKFEQPELATPAPDVWHFATIKDFKVGAVDVSSWWYRFDDPQLVSLISEAQLQNLTLKMAVSNLLQARAAYGVASSELSPDIGAQGHIEREQASDNSPSLANFPNIEAMPVNDFTVGLDASWELDLWGGIEKNVEAASALEGAALENYRDALITLRAEVASSYINIRVLQVTKELTKQSLSTLQHLLTLIEMQYEQGVISKAVLEQERAMYDQNAIQLPEVEMQLVQEYARLAVLLGSNTKDIIGQFSKRSSVPCATPNIAVGIPTDIVRRRPDIRGAERNLAAQTALVGASMSNIYPKLSLSGAFGYEATESSDLIRWNSRSWGFGPSVSWDLFNGNRIRSQVQMQEEKTHEAFMNWELTVLSAFAEVESSLLNVVESGKVQDAINDASLSLFETYKLTEQEHKAGVVAMQQVLNSRTNFINSQIMLAQKTGAVSQNLVTLYKSLGGDWKNDNEQDITQVRNTQ